MIRPPSMMATIANEAQAHAGLFQFGDFGAQVAAQQAGEVENFAGGAAPVLTAEGVDGQPGDASLDGGLHRAADGAGALAMAGDARQAARLCPATVAVHDNGHVVGCDEVGRDLAGGA